MAFCPDFAPKINSFRPAVLALIELLLLLKTLIELLLLLKTLIELIAIFKILVEVIRLVKTFVRLFQKDNNSIGSTPHNPDLCYLLINVLTLAVLGLMTYDCQYLCQYIQRAADQMFIYSSTSQIENQYIHISGLIPRLKGLIVLHIRVLIPPIIKRLVAEARDALSYI